MIDDRQIYLDRPGQRSYSPALVFGMLLEHRFRRDPHFYLFSPDETTSNKLSQVYQATSRAWSMPHERWDLPEHKDGRIVEMLSENTLFATMIGHIMNGEQAMMTSYEAFFNIITAQIIQHIKFLEQSDGVSWRPNLPAVNLLSTSTCWRQDHNGFSHQSPALISALLNLPSKKVNCLFPVDDIAAATAFNRMITSENVVNLTTFNKNEQPRWTTPTQSEFQFEEGGADIFAFASDPNPNIIITAVGDIPSTEALFAIRILKNDLPEAKIRFVNINALSYNAIGTVDNQLTQESFNHFFTEDKLILANFHGYPATLEHIFNQYTSNKRVRVHGFSDHGTTTTPFEMLSLNQASRYHLAIDVASQFQRKDLVSKYQDIITKNHYHANEFGTDLPHITRFHF